jgi:hypothetical protein
MRELPARQLVRGRELGPVLWVGLAMWLALVMRAVLVMPLAVMPPVAPMMPSTLPPTFLPLTHTAQSARSPRRSSCADRAWMLLSGDS